MNWAVFALCVSAVLVAIWLWLVFRRNWSLPGLYASLGCLIAACFNAAAPVRGVLDPNYVGYQFVNGSCKIGSSCFNALVQVGIVVFGSGG